jgi:signal transduction histidine kinase
MSGLPETLYSAGHKPFDFQVERLIALLRVALAAFSIVTFYVDPIRGDQNPTLIVAALIAYAMFGVLVASVPVIGHFRTGWQLPVHMVDIGLISLLLFFLENISKQFLLLYTFVLLGATVRWNWRGAAITTVLLLSLGLLLALLTRVLGGPQTGDDPNLMTLTLLIQSAFLLVIGGMFTFFGASRERSQTRLAELAAWPPPPTDASEDLDSFPLDTALTHVAAVLQAPRVLVLWEQSDEPFLQITLWTNGRCHQDREPAGAFGNWTAPDLTALTFVSANVSSKRCLTVGGALNLKETLIDSSLESQYRLKSVASAPFTSAICTGRIFMLDKPEWGEDDLTLTEIVASRIGIELEQYILRLKLADTAAVMERIRVARDLHDGILQSLTAAGLKLKAVASDVRDGTKSTIDDVRRLLFDEQRRIRVFVEERQKSTGQSKLALDPKMREIIENSQRHWGCHSALSVTPEDTEIRSGLARQLDFLLAEAIANAVRHGQASRIDVRVEMSSDRLLLWIKDNGHGLVGVAGVYDLTELAAAKIGPVSLKNRIAELKGSLTLSSSSEGVELRIDLPT